MLIASVAYIMWLDVFKEPVQTQVWPSCTIESIYTCSYNKERDPKEERDKINFVTHTSAVAEYARTNWLAKTRQINKSKWLIELRNESRVLLDIWQWDNIDKYRIGSWKNQWHAICWVWSITIQGKEWIVAKNTYWEENGIMGYNLIDPKVVKRFYLIQE